MDELIVSERWMFLLFALAINLFASFTMFNMIGQLKHVGVRRNYWLLSGAAVYGLGLWVCHFVMLIAADYMIMIDWTSIVKLLCLMICAYFSLLLLGSRLGLGLRLLASSFVIAAGSNFMSYSRLMSEQVLEFKIHFGLAFFALVVTIIGAGGAFFLFQRKSRYSMLLAGLILGLSGIAMQLLGLEAVTIEYDVVLTADRLSEYLKRLSVVLGIATLVIFAFSTLARFVDRRYNAMDERYKLLVENSIDMIAIIGDEKWEYINRSGLQMFESTSEAELLGTSIYRQLLPVFHPAMKSMLQATAQGVQRGPIEIDWYTMNGKLLHTEVVETCTQISGRPVFQVIVRDISERKKNEELLINSEKLYVAGQLAAGIAHEIRNPLTSLKGFLQLMSSGRQSNKNYYDIMKSELNRIESIVSELLMLSKPQIYELSCKDIRLIIRDTVTLLEAQALLHSIEMEMRVDDDPLWVRGVENQLKQVFINVVKNAIESMLEGGKIIISCMREDDHVIIRIEDYGPGIPEEQLSKIGQPFYTTKEKGTGLGLMVSYKIVDNHQGRIQVRSSLGVGTTFDIILPCTEAPTVHEPDATGKVTPMNRIRQEDGSS
ncbi:Adaptive-response sensory-kinase SasA [Paenibacillus plantiphilus]|uniref:histidine kinase n=1 Tax=Paenibacillus plantiphilus TaxID=2905650 RepID=A0ABN8GTL5_9BACL|nr:ATP-binding protein [Paenibacillus plantiphilus]CAH1217831.1 Adaptive-response sensory-kinase SasA [Paenibacillus plantiphilus]